MTLLSIAIIKTNLSKLRLKLHQMKKHTVSLLLARKQTYRQPKQYYRSSTVRKSISLHPSQELLGKCFPGVIFGSSIQILKSRIYRLRSVVSIIGNIDPSCNHHSFDIEIVFVLILQDVADCLYSGTWL